MKTSLHKEMKKLFTLGILIIMAMVCPQHTNAQQKSVGFNNSTPDVSAVIDAQSGASSSQGILLPRVNLTTPTFAFPSPGPATHLFVVNTSSTFGRGIGLYRNSGTAGTPAWKKLVEEDDAWSTTGNANTTASTSVIGVAANNNFIGTTSSTPFVIATSGFERMRFDANGGIGINTIAPTANTLLTINPTTNTMRNGIDMTMTNATAGATGLNITTGNLNVNGITVTHSSTSTASAFYGIGSILNGNVTTKRISGYLGYHSSGDNGYGIYTTAGSAAWAGYFQGKVAITNDNAPTSTADLEVQNTVAGTTPVTFSLRPTTQVTSTGDIAAVNFGTSYSTSPQAQIKAVRSGTGSGSATDLPTDIVTSVTPDGSSTLTEGTRLSNAGNFGIGNNSPGEKLVVNGNEQLDGALKGTVRYYTSSSTTTSFTTNADYLILSGVSPGSTTGTYLVTFSWNGTDNNAANYMNVEYEYSDGTTVFDVATNPYYQHIPTHDVGTYGSYQAIMNIPASATYSFRIKVYGAATYNTTLYGASISAIRIN